MFGAFVVSGFCLHSLIYLSTFLDGCLKTQKRSTCLFLSWGQLRYPPPTSAGSVEGVPMLDLNDMVLISEGFLEVESHQLDDGGLEVTLKDCEDHPFLRWGIFLC